MVSILGDGQFYTPRPKTTAFMARISCGRLSIPPLGTPEAYSLRWAPLKDRNLRKTMGQNAKNSLDFNFSIENMVKNIQALYENSLRNLGVMC